MNHQQIIKFIFNKPKEGLLHYTTPVTSIIDLTHAIFYFFRVPPLSDLQSQMGLEAFWRPSLFYILIELTYISKKTYPTYTIFHFTPNKKHIHIRLPKNQLRLYISPLILLFSRLTEVSTIPDSFGFMGEVYIDRKYH